MQASICEFTFKCIIQVHELAPLYLCAQILIDPFPLSYLSPYVKVLPFYLCFSPNLMFVHYFSPFVINDHKGSILDRLDYQCQSMGWGSFSQIWSNLDHLPKIFNSVWSKGSFFIPHCKGYLDHVELNTYSSSSRSNTRFTNPQTCHMLPLDHFKHKINSGTIQASNLFDFHEWAYSNVKYV